ncbi:DUF6443 domain-containing protein [Chryseobacterium sp. c4a]|uniref:DUF6443 domain-containing protein n=1 Tax=Chryseobacterium sp. c4a TaxID=1573582 RepID=UPI00135BDFB4|nr:DUF6443 domain-containing protein [Chryseobacterium sp. c4a]
MKKIIIPISALLLMGTIKAQVQLPSGLAGSSTENYVYTRTYLEEKTQSDPAAKQAQTVQYFDGLGRPKQVVNVKASPQGKDVVIPIEYDPFGRQVKDYLPIPQSGTLNGAIIPDPLSSATNSYGSEKIYSEKVLEKSPLDRILQQVQPGNDWANKPVGFGYEANLANEVYQYTTKAIWENGATKSELSLSPATFYAPGTLYKNTVTDEDGNPTVEFKNGRGQTLLVRKVNSTENADTYYVYNEYDQLAFVIPPKAVNKGTAESLLNDLCYQYRYDSRNRLAEKKLPGKGWEYMVYDKADRLVLTQDANLREKGQWMFTKYDQLSRPIYTGILDSPPGRVQQASVIEGHGSNSEIRSVNSWNNSGIDVFYTSNKAYPTSNFKLLSVNYYDTYPSYNFNPPFPSTIQGEATLTETMSSEGRSTKGLPVMSLVKNIENDGWTKNYTYYDTKGRAIGTHSINHLGGYTKTESKLDFAGVAQTVITKHKRLETDSERVITENFEYDHQNRLLVHKHQVDSNPVEILTQNAYNELSQLESKKVGGVSLGSSLQQIDYKYNIRGWMTQINDPSNLNGDLFGYKMKYNNPASIIGRFNGNITEVDWKTSTDGIYRRYNYSYDSLNRMFHAFYSKPGSTVEITSAYNEWLQYDLNGNIIRLDRYGQSDGNNPIQIDQLYYTYQGNRLASVSDASGNFSGYPIGGNPIAYDANGNMIDHLDKGIKEIKYNFLNLPIFVGDTSNIMGNNTSYLYRVDGTKVRKIYSYYKHGSFGDVTYTQNITDYLDGFHYVLEGVGLGCLDCPPPSPNLQFVPTSEGYYDFLKNTYIYNYLDHLGNVRMSYQKGTTGTEVIEESNYYPFGLKHEGYNASLGNPAYNYKYNGKELQENGMYDYGARMYMPDLGRWGVVDPLAEKMTRHSPYNYVFNNPVMHIDPDGREPDIPGGPKPRVLAVFYHGGPTGDGKMRSNTKDAGGAGTRYNATASYARSLGMDFKGAMISPALTQGAGVETGKEFLEKNYQKGDVVLVYGYSYGGDNAVSLAEETPNVPIDTMIIVDSSDGPLRGLTVNTSISDNVNSAYVFYQENNSGASSSSRASGSSSGSSSNSSNRSDGGSSNSPGSRGYRHTSEGKAKVTNIKLSGKNLTHGNIQTKAGTHIQTAINKRLDEANNR